MRAWACSAALCSLVDRKGTTESTGGRGGATVGRLSIPVLCAGVRLCRVSPRYCRLRRLLADLPLLDTQSDLKKKNDGNLGIPQQIYEIRYR